MPSSSFLLGVGAVLSTLSSTTFAAKYQVQDSYTGANWLDAFKFETYTTNNGFVDYQTEASAKSRQLYKIVGNDVMFGVDSTETLNSADGGSKGRKSVRLEGKKIYNHGLFVIDVKAMPNACGMWPSFWSLGGDTWPVKGEIDIIEGVNQNSVNKNVLHTDKECKVDGTGQTGNQRLYDCSLYGPSGVAGCDVDDVRTNSFGAGFNANGGGIYAMEWDSDAIRTWFFPRGSSIPASLTTSEPNSEEFGTPAAHFQGDCNIDERFKDHHFIFTTNFCGDWAGQNYYESSCPQYKDSKGATLSPMASCKKFVAENPKAFENQFWRVSSFKTYQKKSLNVLSSSSVAQTSTRASSSPIRSPSSTPVRSSSVRSSSVQASSTPVRSSSVYASSTPARSSSAGVSSSVHVSSSVPDSSSAYIASSSAVVSASSASSSVAYSASTSCDSSALSPSGTSSTIVYPASSQSTPCTTSSAKSVYETSAYPVYPESSASAYPVYPDSKSSAPVYGENSVYPSKSVHDDYDYLPEFTPVSPIYPEVTSKPAYGSGYDSYPEGSKTSVTTTYTTTYVDVCETGYTTITTEHVVTYYPSTTPAAHPTPGSDYPVYPPPGFEVTTKVCTQGCGKGPTTVTVTVPCSKCGGKDYPTEETSKLTTPAAAYPTKPACNGYDCKGEDEMTMTTKVYQTNVITLSMIPVPESEYYAQQPSSAVYGADKPSMPAYGGDMPAKPVETPAVESVKPVQPSAGYPVSNATMSYGTGYVKPSATKTGYGAPEFTGAASGLQTSGVVAAVVAFAAFML